MDKIMNSWKSFKEWFRLRRKTKADWYEFFPVVEDFQEKIVRDRQENGHGVPPDKKKEYDKWLEYIKNKK